MANNITSEQADAQQQLDDLTVLQNVVDQNMGLAGLNVARPTDVTNTQAGTLGTIIPGSAGDHGPLAPTGAVDAGIAVTVDSITATSKPSGVDAIQVTDIGSSSGEAVSALATKVSVDTSSASGAVTDGSQLVVDTAAPTTQDSGLTITSGGPVAGPAIQGAALPVDIAPASTSSTGALPPVNHAPVFDTETNAVTANDHTAATGKIAAHDVDSGDTVTYHLVDPVTGAQVDTITTDNGTVVIDPKTGEYTFTPNADQSHLALGETSVADFHAVAVDNNGAVSAPVDVTVTVTGSDDAPTITATHDVTTTTDHTAISGSVSGADIDHGAVVSYHLVDSNGNAVDSLTTTNGVVNINPATGEYTFTPVNQSHLGVGETATDSFRVVAQDEHGMESTPSTVHVSITGTDDAPTVAQTAVTTSTHDGQVNGSLSVTTVDDNASLTFSVAGNGPAHGTATVDENGAYSYQPNQHFVGTDTFTIAVDDGHGGTTSQTITVNAVADAAPTVTVSGGTGFEGHTHTGAVTGTDQYNDTMTYTLDAQNAPTHGTVVLNQDGTYTYTPTDNHVGSDTFTVKVDDGYGGTKDQTVTVQLDANPITLTSTDGSGHGTVTGSVHSSDAASDTMTTTVTQGQHGTVTLAQDGTYTYTDTNSGWQKGDTDTFTVQTSDGHGGTAAKTVTVTDTDTAPITAATQSFADRENSAGVSGQVHATDAEHDALAFTIAQNGSPAHGTVNLNADGTFAYTPAAGFAGADSFTVQVSDGHGGTASQVVNITTTADGAPTVVTAGGVGYEGHTLTGSVTGSDSFNDKMSYSLDTTAQAGHGTVTLNADGSYTYTATDNHVGTDTFKVLVDDGHGGVADQTVTVNLAADPTTIIAPAGAGHGVATGKISASDLAGDNETISVSQGTHGTVVLAADGTYTYHETNTNWQAGTTDTFTVTANDGHGGITTKVVTVTDTNSGPSITGGFSASGHGIETGKVMSVDTDNDALTASLVNGHGPVHGGVTVGADGTYTYHDTNASWQAGDTDTFTVQVSDGHGGLASHVVTVTDTDVAPVIDATHSTISENITFGTAGHGTIVAADADHDTLTYSVLADNTTHHGTMSIDATTGAYTYNDTGTTYTGTDTFTVQVSDGHGGTDTQTVTFNDTSATTEHDDGHGNHWDNDGNKWDDNGNKWDSHGNHEDKNGNWDDGKGNHWDNSGNKWDDNGDKWDSHGNGIDAHGHATVNVATDNHWGGGWYAWDSGNPGQSGTGDMFSIEGYQNHTGTVLNGHAGDTIQMGGTGNDYLSLDDGYGHQMFSGYDNIKMGDNANSVVDMTTPNMNYGDINITAGSGHDVIWAAGGNDTITTGAGVDTVHAGSGDDTIVVGTGDGTLLGQDGSDNFLFDFSRSVGHNFIDGGAGGGWTDTISVTGLSDSATMDIHLDSGKSWTVGVEDHGNSHDSGSQNLGNDQSGTVVIHDHGHDTTVNFHNIEVVKWDHGGGS